MLIVLAFIILFHLATSILLFVATIHNAWWVVSDGDEVIYTDLWYSCNQTCYPVENSHTVAAAYLQAVQATIILATILCCVSFFVFILQLFSIKQGERFIFTAVIQLLASLCVLIAASIYTAENKSFHEPRLRKGTFGSSYILAWICFPMTLVSGLMYLVLRKRK
ncbi:epithelial membrane protein 2 [Austrofundulus limnaeus]|uniref:Epithelial membrane protein 2 n=1 Tax=Austrofundulus limnaeus TaxID=52670 RepID=A0A2I4B3Q7_AUSLI|nr:PREDICTED: epithelial membrane protein 2 [Austrofundulus limnaeus]XP_013862383.1 PREDICTED: epithelial membrane protein 2 [Austrofundulus limnaeus]XP_013862384.1 PREDICTED: epithelial membrane protein 2 [Austrofundulus limnaeus]